MATLTGSILKENLTTQILEIGVSGWAVGLLHAVNVNVGIKLT